VLRASFRGQDRHHAAGGHIAMPAGGEGGAREPEPGLCCSKIRGFFPERNQVLYQLYPQGAPNPHEMKFFAVALIEKNNYTLSH